MRLGGGAYGMIPAMVERVKDTAVRHAANRHTSDNGPQDDAAWDAFVGSHPQAHFLQTSSWAALKARFGWETLRVGLHDGEQPIAGASILLRRVAGLGIAYVPRGPVVDWANPAQVADVLESVTTQAHRAGAAVLRIEPELADSPSTRRLLAANGFVPTRQTIQPPSTIILSLAGSEDDVLQRMKSKWRYNVRLAQRKKVTVRQLAREELPIFHQLMNTTGARDGFDLHSAEYYAAAYDLLTPGMGAFFVAEYEGEPLGALVAVACGDLAWYLWGASSNRHRNRMPNHVLQWAAMRWGRARGATRYDFWGIPDEIGAVAAAMRQGWGTGTPVEEVPLDLELLPNDELWGVYRFKQGFGGQVVRYAGTWDKPLDAVRYRVVQVGTVGRTGLNDARQLLAVCRNGESSGRGTGLERQTVDNATAWREALRELPMPHVLQSWEWGDVKWQTGWHASRLTLRDRRGAQVALQLLDRQLHPRIPLRVGYVPKGPVLDWQNHDHMLAALDEVQRLARARHCIFVKIDPDVAEDSDAGIRLRNELRRRGWRFSQEQIQFKNSAVTDLIPGEDVVREGMKSKWRYNVRLAARRGITVRRGTAADLAAFYAMYQTTGERDGFLIRPFDYYRTTWETYLQAEADSANPAGGALLLAEHADEDAPVAGLFLLRYGDCTWYFYGASSDRRRRDMPNYLLQWEAMRWAIDHGCTVYDWWGAPSDLNDPDDGLQGVWQFKQGFGAQFAPHVGAWDYPVYPWLYRAYTDLMPGVLDFLRRRNAAAPAG